MTSFASWRMNGSGKGSLLLFRLADAIAMELIHKRHDKREIVNVIRWCLMGCPLN